MLFSTKSGTGSQLIDFQRYDTQPGMLFTMYPGQIHAWEARQEIEGYVLFFTDDFFNLRYHNHQLREFPFFNYETASPFIQIDLASRKGEEFLSLWESMLSESLTMAKDYEKVLRSYLNILLLLSQREYYFQYGVQNQEENQGEKLIKQFTQLIGKHYFQKHQVKDYAEILLISPNYLNTLCTRITGKHAGVLIRDRIMLEAKRHLIHETQTVAQIGMELGFEDNSYFSRFFRKYSGMSPEMFRRENR
ncbi:MAG: helix-turn-helix domain-containing protein [Haliscomenobacter sp.]|nr:helix-turn-helix domain-containing protein [Haliscomenobacter sp.]